MQRPLIFLILLWLATTVQAGGDTWTLLVDPIHDRELEMGETMQIQARITTAGKTVTWSIASQSGPGTASINSAGLLTYTAPTGAGGTKTVTIRATSTTDSANTDTETIVFHTRERIPGLGPVTIPTYNPSNEEKPGGFAIASAVDPTNGELWQLYTTDYSTELGHLVAIRDAAGASPQISTVATASGSGGPLKWRCDIAVDADGIPVVVWASVDEQAAEVQLWARRFENSAWSTPQFLHTVGDSFTSGVGSLALACSLTTGGSATVVWHEWEEEYTAVRSSRHSGAWTSNWTVASTVAYDALGNVDVVMCAGLDGGSDRTFCAYHNETNPSPLQSDVYVRQWTGSVWGSATPISIPNSLNHEFGPTLACSPNGEHLWLTLLGEVSGGDAEFYAVKYTNSSQSWPPTASAVQAGTSLFGAAAATVVDDRGEVTVAVTGEPRTISSFQETRLLVFRHDGGAWTTWDPSPTTTWTEPNSDNTQGSHPAAEVAWVRSGQTTWNTSAALAPDGSLHLSWEHAELQVTPAVWEVAHRLLDHGITVDDDTWVTDDPIIEIDSALADSSGPPSLQIKVSGQVLGSPTWVTLTTPNAATLVAPGMGDHEREIVASHRYSGLTRETWPARDTINLWLHDLVPDTVTVAHVTPGDEASVLEITYSDTVALADDIGLKRAPDLGGSTWAPPADFAPDPLSSYAFPDEEAVDDKAPLTPEPGDPPSYPDPGLVTNEAVIVRWLPTEDVGGDWFWRFVADDESTGHITNLIQNGSFEWDEPEVTTAPFPDTLWTTYNSNATNFTMGVEEDTTAPDGGQSYHIALSSSATGTKYAEITHRLPDAVTDTDAWYLVQVRVKGVAPLVRMMADDAGVTWPDYERWTWRAPASSASWQEVTFPYHHTQGRPRLFLRISANFDPGEDLWIDDLRVTRLHPDGHTALPPGLNLISNGDFSADAVGTEVPAGWTATTGVGGQVVSDESFIGDQAYRIINSGASATLSTSVSAPVEAGDIVRLCARVRSVNGQPVRLRAEQINSGVSSIHGDVYSLANDGTWEDVEFLTVAEAGYESLEASLKLIGDGTSAEVEIDELRLDICQAGQRRTEGLGNFEIEVAYKDAQQQLHTLPPVRTAAPAESDLGLPLTNRDEPYTLTLVATDAGGLQSEDVVYGEFDARDAGYGDVTQPYVDENGIVQAGASTSGVVDATTPLQAQFDRMRGGIAFLPTGRYLVTDTITLQDIHILGGTTFAGAFGSFIILSPSNEGPLCDPPPSDPLSRTPYTAFELKGSVTIDSLGLAVWEERRIEVTDGEPPTALWIDCSPGEPPPTAQDVIDMIDESIRYVDWLGSVTSSQEMSLAAAGQSVTLNTTYDLVDTCFAAGGALGPADVTITNLGMTGWVLNFFDQQPVEPVGAGEVNLVIRDSGILAQNGFNLRQNTGRVAIHNIKMFSNGGALGGGWQGNLSLLEWGGALHLPEYLQVRSGFHFDTTDGDISDFSLTNSIVLFYNDMLRFTGDPGAGAGVANCRVAQAVFDLPQHGITYEEGANPSVIVTGSAFGCRTRGAQGLPGSEHSASEGPLIITGSAIANHIGPDLWFQGWSLPVIFSGNGRLPRPQNNQYRELIRIEDNGDPIVIQGNSVAPVDTRWDRYPIHLEDNDTVVLTGNTFPLTRRPQPPASEDATVRDSNNTHRIIYGNILLGGVYPPLPAGPDDPDWQNLP